MQRTLVKYRIGLTVLALLTLAILVIVLLQASVVRQDQKTEDAANSIATQLNNYTDSNYGNPAPSSLSQIGITNVPATISYTRTGHYSYQFCMTFKQASTSFDAMGLEQELIARGLSADASSNNYAGDQSSYNNLPDLYISPIHHKGVNCQTVELSSYINSSPGLQVQ